MPHKFGPKSDRLGASVRARKDADQLRENNGVELEKAVEDGRNVYLAKDDSDALFAKMASDDLAMKHENNDE